MNKDELMRLSFFANRAIAIAREKYVELMAAVDDESLQENLEIERYEKGLDANPETIIDEWIIDEALSGEQKSSQ